MRYRKRLIPTGFYHATIRSAENYENTLRLTWTIDRGDFAYRNLIKRYPLNEWGIEQLKMDLEPLGFILYEDYNDPFFWEQFDAIDFRSKIKVDRIPKDRTLINIITEYVIPDKPRDYNIKKPKTDEFYNKQNKGRKLPINLK